MAEWLKAALVGDLKEIAAAEAKQLEADTREGVFEAGRAALAKYRAQVTGAGLGDRLANAIRLKTYPNQGKNPAAFIYPKGSAEQIIQGFDTGGVVKSKHGKFLAIPTSAAPKRGADGKHISPTNFPKALGELRFIPPRRGRPGLLVVDNVRLSDKTGRARSLTRKNKEGNLVTQLRGRTTAIMFILVPTVNIKKRLNIGGLRDEAATDAAARIAGNLVRSANGQ